MRLLHGALILPMVASENYKLCLGNAGVPVSDGYANPGPIENGVVTCKDDYCTTNCDLMYDWYNGQSKTKCKLNGNGKWAWTNQLGECKTCGPLKLNTAEIDVDCFTRKSSDRGSLFCKISCKNNLKPNAVAIKPINKMKSYAVCRCVTAPQSLADKDGSCHWRIANRIIDTPRLKNSYMENFYCFEPESRIQSAESVTGSMHIVYRVPSNMVCQQQRPLKSRIVGGVTAIAHSWPWIMNMMFGGMVCAGTIIDDETVLTVAHCCDKYRNKPQFVRGTIGDHNWKRVDDGEHKSRAISIHVHPSYNRHTMENDICVVKFPSFMLNRRKTAAHACLPPVGETPPHGTRCWSAGWGMINNGTLANVLQEVDLKIISDEVCQKTHTSSLLIKDSNMCAGWVKGGKDACQGDSGGPLICQDGQNQPVLTGVTSWGVGCGMKNKPGLWTKVSSFVTWIQSHML